MTAAISPRPARLILFAIASWYTGRWELSRIWEAIAISLQQSVRAKEALEPSTLAPELRAESRLLSAMGRPVAAVSRHLLEFPFFEAETRRADRTRIVMLQDADALPQLIGDYKPVDQWQVHINRLFYRFRGDQVRSFYQTFASADYRLAHALAADYFEKVVKRDRSRSKGVTGQRGSTDSGSTTTPATHPLPHP